ncbi:MAG: hypothetical protein JWN65_2124 [Solirubrobacterales bacterium]|nr:hypothetical protein [Solirubrobacterales bacterium]
MTVPALHARLATACCPAGHGHATGEALEAVAPAPSLALTIELGYTGKALGRLLPVHAAGGYGDGPVVFLHTNGPRP